MALRSYTQSSANAPGVRSWTVAVPRLGSRIAVCVVLTRMAAALVMCAVLLLGQQQAAPPSTADDLPVSLDRIQRALSTKPAIELKEQHPVFRLEIFGSKPTLEDILGEKFWLGPSKYGSMTHQEFMDKVTSPE